MLLAPLYDLAPTLLLLEHLVREGAAWGMDEDDARQTAVSALEAVAAAAAGSCPPEQLGFLRDLVPARVKDLLNGGTARRSLH